MPDAAPGGEGNQLMAGIQRAQTSTMSHQLSSMSTPPAASKRSSSPDSHRSEPSRLTTPGANDNGQHTGGLVSRPDVNIPTYLNQQKLQITKRFQDLEWQQRYRLQHAYNHPETSPFRMDKSDTVINRNRYSNVQPWDPSRVKLRTPIGGSDYINASPISLNSHISTASTRVETTPASTTDNSLSSVKLSEMRYIATQGPKDDQFAHFWYMVMQETVGPVAVIVMLTQCYEGFKEKCSQYFPKDMDHPVLVLDSGELAAAEAESENEPTVNSEMSEPDGTASPGSVEVQVDDPGSDSEPQTKTQKDASAAHPASGSVTLLSLNMDSQSRCEIRRMRLEIDGETKEIFHYLFSGWADFGKPEGEDRRALVELTRQTRERAQASEIGGGGLPVGSHGNPRFVHCSAGVGRTGTFIALDWLLYQLEQGNLTAAKQDANAAAYQENNKVNGNSKTKLWGRSGPVKEREATPEASDSYDLIYDTVNRLREQRMMMVMNELQYSFLYEVVKEAFVEKYARAPTVGVVNVGDVEKVNAAGVAVRAEGDDNAGAAPDSNEADVLSEAETEIEGDPYEAVAPQEIREEVEGAKGVGVE